MKNKYDGGWFKHLIDSQGDPKIQALLKKFGMSAYGLYWTLIETLYRSDESSFNILLKDGIDIDNFDEIMDYMIDIKLFYIEENEIKSKRVDSVKNDWNETSNIRSKAGKASAEKRKNKL